MASWYVPPPFSRAHVQAQRAPAVRCPQLCTPLDGGGAVHRGVLQAGAGLSPPGAGADDDHDHAWGGSTAAALARHTPLPSRPPFVDLPSLRVRQAHVAAPWQPDARHRVVHALACALRESGNYMAAWGKQQSGSIVCELDVRVRALVYALSSVAIASPQGGSRGRLSRLRADCRLSEGAHDTIASHEQSGGHDRITTCAWHKTWVLRWVCGGASIERRRAMQCCILWPHAGQHAGSGQDAASRAAFTL